MPSNTPPRDGLTRTPTGYPADPLYPGWHWTEAEVRAIHRRADRRAQEPPEHQPLSRRQVHPDTAPTPFAHQRRRSG